MALVPLLLLRYAADYDGLAQKCWCIDSVHYAFVWPILPHCVCACSAWHLLKVVVTSTHPEEPEVRYWAHAVTLPVQLSCQAYAFVHTRLLSTKPLCTAFSCRPLP